VLAGGQSLIPMVKLRFAAPELLVDINDIPELAYHRRTRTGRCASARCAGTPTWSFPRCCPAVGDDAAAAPLIADPIVRNRGTLVGSLCHADRRVTGLRSCWRSVVRSSR